MMNIMHNLRGCVNSYSSVKYLNGAPLTHVTENYFNDDWKEVKFVEE